MAGATPQSEGLVRVRGRACFHTLAPAPGSLPRHQSLREGRRQDPVQTPFVRRGGSTGLSPAAPPLPKRLAPILRARVRARSQRSQWRPPPRRPWPRHHDLRPPLRNASVRVRRRSMETAAASRRRHSEEHLAMNHPNDPLVRRSLVRRSRMWESFCLNRWSTWTLVSPVCAALQRS